MSNLSLIVSIGSSACNSVFWEFKNLRRETDGTEWCSGRDSDPGPRLERPLYLTGLYYRSKAFSVQIHSASINLPYSQTKLGMAL